MAAEPLCLAGGELVPLDQARISPLDRGFLFGDAVYEAVKLLAGRPLFLEAHLVRLAKSLAAMRIPAPAGLDAALARLVAESGVEAGVLYLQISRGAAPTRSHLPPPEIAPTLFAFAAPLDFPAEPWTLPGLAAISRPDDRWRHCDVKITALAANVLGKLEADAGGAVEALFVGPEGTVREGGNTNLFARDARGWHTHPVGPEILAGVTRAHLVEIARAEGLPLEERAPRLAERAVWREALLCGTLTGVRGLTKLDGTPIGDGAVGAETTRFAKSLAALERAAALEVR